MASHEAFESLEYWREKCSICFENRCEFCFPGCEDQFCTACIRRYFKEVVDNSWGLAGCKMKCPVCYVVLSKETWTKYADKKTIQRYEAFNKPYRAFSRFCHTCGGEVAVSKPPSLELQEQQKTVDRILDMVETLIANKEGIFQKIQQDLSLAMGKVKTIADVYLNTSKVLETFVAESKLFERTQNDERGEKRRKINEINHDLLTCILTAIISLELDAEKWRELQHIHIKNFPKHKCELCNTQICFHCGEPTWHEDTTCKDYLQRRLSSCENELSATIEWTIQNGKRCPNCSIIINRDEGCNRVDCLHCGFSFCWICEAAWSSGCGFFRCSLKEETVQQTEVSQAEPSTTQTANKRARPAEESHQPEIGVPNIDQIEKRISNVQEKSQNRQGLANPQPAAVAVVVAVAVAPAQAVSQSPRFIKDWLLFSRLFWD